MTDVVRERFLEFTEPLEGGVGCLYQDVRGKVTIAYGNLVDTPSEAASLPLVHPGGTPATTAEKVAAWHAVKSDPNGARLGWRHSATLTDLRLTDDAMAAMALGRFDANEDTLRYRLPDWESYPACARMAFHSLAWACGANCHYPHLFADAIVRNWDSCAIEIRINDWTPEGIHNVGVVPRNTANAILMQNAQRVDDYKLDPDFLNWTALIGVKDTPTQPDLVVVDPTPLPCVNTAIMTPVPENNATSPTIHPSPSEYLQNAEPNDDEDEI